MLSIFPRIDWPSVCLLWQMFLKLCLFFENSFICSSWVISITLLVHWSILLHHLIYSCFLMFFVCLFVSVIVFFSSLWFFFILSNPLYYLTFLFWVFLSIFMIITYNCLLSKLLFSVFLSASGVLSCSYKVQKYTVFLISRATWFKVAPYLIFIGFSIVVGPTTQGALVGCQALPCA